MHTLEVVDVSDTVSPDDAVGASANGVADHERSDGAVKVMVWLAFTSEIAWLVLLRRPDE